MKRLLLVLLLLLPSLSFGQTLLLPGVLQQFTDESGVPIAGGFVCTTISGTSTNLATYPTSADALAGTNPNSNPVTMDSAGRVAVWLKPSSTYRIIIYKAGTGSTCNGSVVGTAVRTIDGVSANPVTYPITAAQGGTGLTTYAIGDMIYASATTPTLARLADVAVNKPLLSGGVNTAPAYASYSIAAPSTSGNHMTSDGTNWTSVDPYAAARFEIVSGTKNVADANADQVFTGCGFAPVALLAMGHLSSTSTNWGFVEHNSTTESGQKSSYSNGGAVLFTGGADTTLLFNVLVDSSNLNQARVTAWGSDGFTLSWVKTMSPTGTLDMTIMCIR